MQKTRNTSTNKKNVKNMRGWKRTYHQKTRNCPGRSLGGGIFVDTNKSPKTLKTQIALLGMLACLGTTSTLALAEEEKPTADLTEFNDCHRNGGRRCWTVQLGVLGIRKKRRWWCSTLSDSTLCFRKDTASWYWCVRGAACLIHESKGQRTPRCQNLRPCPCLSIVLFGHVKVLE